MKAMDLILNMCGDNLWS